MMTVVRLFGVWLGLAFLLSWGRGINTPTAFLIASWIVGGFLVLIVVAYSWNSFSTLRDLFRPNVVEAPPAPPARASLLLVENMTGTQFEQFVAQQLRAAGWQATVTPVGADQGLDVMATRGDLKVAIQCKRYLAAVGNAAVQEVHAARTFHGANRAVVVTSSTYTRSAQELASKLDVELLHYRDLSRLHVLLT